MRFKVKEERGKRDKGGQGMNGTTG